MSYRTFERDSAVSGTSAVVDNSKCFHEQPSEAGDEKEGHLESYAITLSESTEASLYQAGERAQFSCAVLRAVVAGKPPKSHITVNICVIFNFRIL